MTSIGVRSHFCAAHKDKRGRLHGHSYVVWAWFPAGRDLLDLKTHLDAAVRVFDHKELPDGLSLMEDMIGSLRINMPTATKIVIERPVEGLAAEWPSAPNVTLAPALARMVYETTSLSPMEDDGSHWCKISKEALDNARRALAQSQEVL